MGLRIEIFLLFIFIQFLVATAQTNGLDLAALENLKDAWRNIPPNWDGHDPCGRSWVGIQCNNSRITSITLGSIGLTGLLTADIAELSELQILDLSHNPGLTGTLTPSIGNLTKLKSLFLGGCGFNGSIPDTIGSLQQLISLDLNSNSFSGSIPPSIGNLLNLYVLDLTNNNLSGTIPVSNGTTPGLDKLVYTWHFHLGNNQLSGAIPSSLFSSSMMLIHVLFENNQFNGSIPSTLALVQKLQVVRLDGNSFTGSVPSQFSNLTSVSVLYLSNNQLSGPIPNLSTMKYLNYVNLSNNTFDASVFPLWLSNLQTLTTIVMENTRLYGPLPGALFNLPQLQTVSLSNNQLNGTLDGRSSYANQLELVDLQNNLISDFIFPERVRTTVEFILVGNPACTGTGGTHPYCDIPLSNSSSYSTPPNNCIRHMCSSNEVSSPNCICAYPYTGTLIFKAPSFSNLRNYTIYTSLEKSLMMSFLNDHPVDSVSLSNLSKNTDNYLLISLEVFPYGQHHFNRTGISGIAFVFSSKTFNPPSTYGTFSFQANPYNYFAEGNNSSNRGVITGAAVGGSVVLLLALLAGFYAFRQKRRAEKADFIPTVINPPPSSPTSKKSKTGLIVGIVVPIGVVSFLSVLALCCFVKRRKRPGWDDDEELLGMDTRPYTFSYAQLKAATEDFNPANKLGEGGFGPVFKGTLNDGRVIAVKQLAVASHQGKSQFIAEITTISAVQHRNLVKLFGCCIEGDKRLLVYEYLENKSLDQALFGKTSLYLDWPIRFDICLGVARGLAYLHEESRVRIVHRDVKASNILLDFDLNPKISDFGLAKLYDDKKTHISTRVAGTIGYLAPEYAMRGHLTEKADVFGFGVVALEIVSGRLNSDSNLEEEKIYLLEWAWRLHENDREVELVDATLLEFDEEEVKRVIGVALLCTQTSPQLRPSMSRAVAMLSGDIEVSAVTTRPGYLTDWKFNDTTSFMTTDTPSGENKHSQFSSSSATTTADPSHSLINAAHQVEEVIGEGR